MAEQRTPLDKVDPIDAWKPWQPTAKDEWGLKWAGHLYRRAAFGASPAELAEAVKAGHQATIDLLLKGKPGSESLSETRDSTGKSVARYKDRFDNADISRLRAWWIYWILKTPHPLREKMTLFWHNHFVSSFDKVNRTIPICNQNLLLYKHALGRFGPFVMAISQDVAMLEYLDSNSNLKFHPNENYGRELMELFTLGVGNYTEKDVREVARAFTGWNTNGDDQFEFVPAVHDMAAKTVLGTTGPLDGKDIVAILLKQPACARFLVGKLYRFLISETGTPPDALLEPLAEQLRKSDYDIAALVATMLSSRHFFSEHAFMQRIKCPVELVIGAVRTTVDPEYVENTLSGQGLVPILESMGQNLFAPPNVKGWRGGKNWLNTATMLARQNFGQSLAMGTLTYNGGGVYQNFAELELQEEALVQPPGRNPSGPMSAEEPAPRREIDPAVIVSNAKVAAPENVVSVLIDAYLPGAVGPTATQKLTAFISQGSPKGKALDRRIREAVHAIVGMPEYQLA